MLISRSERRAAAVALLVAALGGCGARTMLLPGVGAGGQSGTGGQGGTGGEGGSGNGGQGGNVPLQDASFGGSAPVEAGFGGSPFDSGCPVQVQPCYTGPSGTEGVGVCHGGTQTCAGGVFGPCEGEVLPSPEVCDGLDDDCNGIVDDGTCPGETCADSITLDPTSFPSGWMFNGSASWNAAGPWAELTLPANGEAGTVIYRNPILTDDFVATFKLTIGGADGLALMIETAGPGSVGSTGGGLGVAGLGGYAVEFDTYDDGQACGDPNANHVGVDDLTGTCGMGLPVSLGENAAPVMLGDMQTHAAVVTFDQGAVAVTVDGIPAGSFTIPGWVSGQSFYYGFGAGTGDAIGLQVVNAAVVQFPTYRCL